MFCYVIAIVPMLLMGCETEGYKFMCIHAYDKD